MFPDRPLESHPPVSHTDRSTLATCDCVTAGIGIHAQRPSTFETAPGGVGIRLSRGPLCATRRHDGAAQKGASNLDFLRYHGIWQPRAVREARTPQSATPSLPSLQRMRCHRYSIPASLSRSKNRAKRGAYTTAGSDRTSPPPTGTDGALEAAWLRTASSAKKRRSEILVRDQIRKFRLQNVSKEIIVTFRVVLSTFPRATDARWQTSLCCKTTKN